MLKEFRDFLFRGNVVDLAVAFVIAAAFGGVIKSFVDNILTPLLGLLGIPDMSTWSLTRWQRADHVRPLPAGRHLLRDRRGRALLLPDQADERAGGAPPGRHGRGADDQDVPVLRDGDPAAATRCPNCTQPLPA